MMRRGLQFVLIVLITLAVSLIESFSFSKSIASHAFRHKPLSKVIASATTADVYAE